MTKAGRKRVQVECTGCGKRTLRWFHVGSIVAHNPKPSDPPLKCGASITCHECGSALKYTESGKWTVSMWEHDLSREYLLEHGVTPDCPSCGATSLDA